MQNIKKIKLPFNPIYNLIASSLLTFLVGGILFTINNDRIKNENKKKKNIIIVFVVFFIYCFLIYLLPDFKYDRFFIHSINAIVGLILCISQKKSYNIFAQNNNKKPLNYLIIVPVFLLLLCINIGAQLAYNYKFQSSIAMDKMTKARELVEEEKYDQALLILQEIENDFPNKGFFYYALAVTYWKKGENKNALKAIDQSLKYDQNYKNAKELLKKIEDKENIIPK